MRFLILSDLHLELAAWQAHPSAGFDAVILAGDIHSPGHRAVEWARSSAAFGSTTPIILVPGNHEFYGRVLQQELAAMPASAAGTNVMVLDRGEARLTDPQDPAGPGVRILGATLWTDFRLPVRSEDGDSRRDVKRSLATANQRLNDFRVIALSYSEVPDYRSATPRTRRRSMTAEDSLARHWVDRDWLESKLAEPFVGSTIVVTHHAPSRHSVAARYEDDWLTPAFVSDLPSALFDVPELWVHGHTHTSFDYRVGRCRVMSNPRGYPMPGGAFENAAFDAGLIVEVGTRGQVMLGASNENQDGQA